ncbi:DMT family transporter [Nocardioides sp.]|uniref:DMT family transporter n=1 Tax=Nocardioides sp. TaxID=35761 RepID=UPI003D0AC6F7
MTRWLLLLVAILSEVTGSLALKAALEHPPFYALVAIGFLTSFFLLGAVLRRGMPLGVAYGIWAALGVSLTAVTSAILFGEDLTVVMGVGLGLVVAGVLVVQLGSHMALQAHHRDGGV